MGLCMVHGNSACVVCTFLRALRPRGLRMARRPEGIAWDFAWSMGTAHVVCVHSEEPFAQEGYGWHAVQRGLHGTLHGRWEQRMWYVYILKSPRDNRDTDGSPYSGKWGGRRHGEGRSACR